jgi:hypothetical protein
LRTWLLALLAPALLAASGPADPGQKPLVYNYLEGDGSVPLDRAIKGAYGAGYRIVDVHRSDGYREPEATDGDLPTSAKDEEGRWIAGYVLAAYIVTAEGRVADPRVLRSNDPRLSKVALDAMAKWRFTPGTLRGQAVATTAAQEFKFGPLLAATGYEAVQLGSYQPPVTLRERMPPVAAVDDYVRLLGIATEHFFVGAAAPETLHTVVIVRPGRRSRVWFVSSTRPGGTPDFEPLRRILEAIEPFDSPRGPIIIGISGVIAGGDPKDDPRVPGAALPIPAEWLEASRIPSPPALFSDRFIDLVWPERR